MDSDESYHCESKFIPDEMTNENENLSAITKEENRQNLDVFTMANVENYVLAQRAENTVKKARSLLL